MPNMSYCRFENTLNALQDCYDALQDGEAEDHDLSETEERAKVRLIELCTIISEEYD